MTKKSEAEAEDLAAAMRLRKRFPKMQMGKCEVCKCWCITDPTAGNVHPTCVGGTKKRTKKTVSKDQGALL